MLFLMNQRPPKSTSTTTSDPYKTRFRYAHRRSHQADRRCARSKGEGDHAGLTQMEALPSSEGVAAPVHVAIIMDGNGRWAKSRGLPRTVGHRSEEHKSELQSLMRISYAFLCLHKHNTLFSSKTQLT